jgi:hypothetical protein
METKTGSPGPKAPTCEEIRGGSPLLIEENRALGISDFVTSTGLYGSADNLERCDLFYSLAASIRTAAINAGSVPLFFQA